jgi:hypothetical protein
MLLSVIQFCNSLFTELLNMQQYHKILDDLLLVMSILQAHLLIPQLKFLNEEGAHAELWAVSQIFLDTLHSIDLDTRLFQH